MHKNQHNSYDNKKRIWLNYTCTISVVVQCIVVLSPIRKLRFTVNYFIKTPQSMEFYFFACIWSFCFVLAEPNFVFFCKHVWTEQSLTCQNTSAQIVMGKRKSTTKLLETSESCWTELTWCCYLHAYNQTDVFWGGGFIPNLHGDGFREKPKALRSFRQPPSREPCHRGQPPPACAVCHCCFSLFLTCV